MQAAYAMVLFGGLDLHRRYNTGSLAVQLASSLPVEPLN